MFVKGVNIKLASMIIILEQKICWPDNGPLPKVIVLSVQI